jgi:hypothetical protein
VSAPDASKLRVFTDVVDLVLAEVPTDERWNPLRARLMALRESGWFTAPEIMWYRWRDLSAVLADEIGEPDDGWQKNISRIVLDEADSPKEGA